MALYHSAMAHLIPEINDICAKDDYYRFADKLVLKGREFWHPLCMDGADIAAATYYRFADKLVLKGHKFWHLLCMDGADIAAATMCGTDNCPTCECPKAELDNTEKTYPLRKTSDVKKAVDDGRARLLNAHETVKTNKKSAVLVYVS